MTGVRCRRTGGGVRRAGVHDYEYHLIRGLVAKARVQAGRVRELLASRGQRDATYAARAELRYLQSKD